jgi:UDP:flavonoid glycosyltransferase YjiC (YdhE family)
LFASLASHGHTYPLLPLARAARAQGHQVTYATTASFHHVLTPLGLAVEDVGITISDAFAQAMGDNGGGRDEMMAVAMDVFGSVLVRRFYTDLRPVLDRLQPDLVIYEAATMGARFAAAAAGIPVLCHSFGRGALQMPGWDLQTTFGAFAAEVGVEFDSANPVPDPYLDIYPESLQDKEFLAFVNRFPVRPVPFAEPGELPSWVVEHREPLTYLTLGTAFGAASVLKTAIDGLARLPGRVLVAAGPTVETADIGDVPDNVTILPWVPQADLLPYTDLVVHHGGSGTTLGALANGIAQLFLPQGADQFTNAQTVTDGGAGDQLLGDDFDADAVAAKASALRSDDAVRARSREIADEIAAMPSPDEVAARLPGLAV